MTVRAASLTRTRVVIPRHILVAVSGWASRVVSALVQLISVRLLLANLGIEEYAVFALLTGLQGWFLLADLGIGFSTQNHLSEARSRAESSMGILAAARLLAVMLLFLTIGMLYFTSPLLSGAFLQSFPFLSPQRRADLFFMAGALSISFGISSIVYKVWYSEHRGYLSNSLPTAAALIGLLGIWLAGSGPPQNRLELNLVAFLAPTALIPLGVLAVQLLRTARTGWHLEAINRALVLKIARRAGGFWTFAVLSALTLQVDYIVLARFLDAPAIAVYALATKIFGLVFFVYNALLLALWPVFAEQIASHRWAEVKTHLRAYLLTGMLYMVVATVALLWLMPIAIVLLAPNQGLRISATLILLLGAYQVIRVWTDTFAMVLQSMSKLEALWIFVPVQAALSVALQWTLAPELGLYGVVIGLAASFLLTVSWGLPVFANLYARRVPAGQP